jgi:SEC-C motif-containing protein
MAKPTAPTSDACPCGSGQTYARCCGPLHQGDRVADNAEALMRSRYSAYVRGLADYLRATWHPDTCPATLHVDEPGLHWLGLTVRGSGLLGPDEAWVEFVARCKQGGRATRMHERSRFLRVQGRWLYVDGTLGKPVSAD